MGFLRQGYWSGLSFIPPPVDQFCQNSSLWLIHQGWSCTAWLIIHWDMQVPQLQQGCGPWSGMTPDDEPPRTEGVRYATREDQRAITNSSRKNEVAEPKQKCSSGMDVSGGESKVQCCKILHRNLNVRSMNKGKLDMIKQKAARLNFNILGISELKWMGMGKFYSDDYYIQHCGQEPLRRNKVALIVNKRIWSEMKGWFQFVSRVNYSTSQ